MSQTNLSEIWYTESARSTTATKNPFTYRGYYYDCDLELYYLQSRYYDSVVGRFISADGSEYLGANGDLNSYNLYAYCSNNPVMYTDPSGHSIIATMAMFAITGLVIGFFTPYIFDVVEECKDDGFQFKDLGTPFTSENINKYVVSALSGFVLGAAYGTGIGLGVHFFTAANTLSAVSTLISTETIGLAVGGVLAFSTVAGMGIYALDSTNDSNRSSDGMILAGLEMGVQGLNHMTTGLFLGTSGIYSWFKKYVFAVPLMRNACTGPIDQMFE